MELDEGTGSNRDHEGEHIDYRYVKGNNCEGGDYLRAIERQQASGDG